MIYCIVQKPYIDRYTASWYTELERHQDIVKILGPPQSSVCNRTGLDWFGNVGECIGYESEQIQRLLECDLHSGDIILTMDLDFPGVFGAMIPILRSRFKNIPIVGVLHAGPWILGDLFSASASKIIIDQAVIGSVDAVIVATEYHKQRLVDVMRICPDKILTTGGFYIDFLKFPLLRNVNRNGRAMLIGRWEQSDFKYVSELVDVVGWNSRLNYLCSMANYSAVVSMKKDETFGISVIEAMALGVVPFVPDRFGYVETVPVECRYADVDDLRFRLNRYFTDPEYAEMLQRIISGVDYAQYESKMVDLINLVSGDGFRVEGLLNAYPYVGVIADE